VKVVIDSSAILSVLFAEPESDEILMTISNNECFISAGNYLETAIIVDSSKDPIAIRKFDALIKEGKIEILSVDQKQVDVARAAYRDYGKGSGHRAKLNYGDVFAYALAATTRRKLLCKGDDFCHTDIAILDIKSS
jgi:ribonuclease VapC